MFHFDEEWNPRMEQGKHSGERNEEEEERKEDKDEPGTARGAGGGRDLYEDYFVAEFDDGEESASVPMDNRSPPPLPSSSSSSGFVRFIRHPQSDFIVRSRPAQLQCTALNAHRIRMKCNGKWLDDQRVRQDKEEDPESGESLVRAEVEIQRAELEAWLADLGEFACQCWAFGERRKEEEEEEEDEGDEEKEEDRQEASTSAGNEKHKEEKPRQRGRGREVAVRSETAKIRMAYLRKHFHQVPIARRVEEGQSVQLQCEPPDGDPRPEVSWHKNGHSVHFAPGGHLIQAADGALILSAARLSDSGNYSCVAHNPANRRLTEPAQLVVYVDGAWSPWSAWEGPCTVPECPVLSSELAMVRGDSVAVQRVLPRQHRVRSCNNPPPLNGGAGCEGAAEELRECGHACRLEGAWGQWTPWARECDAQCRRRRSRECAAPAPANGGAPCAGPDSQWRNCTPPDELGLPVPAHCLASAASLPPPTSASSSSASDQSGSLPAFFDSQLYALASLGCVAFLLLVIALLCGALLCRKSNRRMKRHKRKKMANGGGGRGGGEHCGVFLDREEKLYLPGTTVAATTEDELGNIHTVLLSSDQKLALLSSASSRSPASFCPASSACSPGPRRCASGTPGALPRFFSLKPTLHHPPPQPPPLPLHPTSSTPPAPAARLASFLHCPATPQQNSYTMRSWNSNSQTQHSLVDMAGSRAPLLPEYSSSSSSTQGSTHTGLSDHRLCPRPPSASGHHPPPPHYRQCFLAAEDNNYATLYEEYNTGGAISSSGAESMTGDSSAVGYALSGGSSSAGTQPIGGEMNSEGAKDGGPTFVAAEVDAESTRIELRHSGAALTIGERTFASARTVFLAVSDDSAERPPLSSEEQERDTWLSSMVSFGLCEEDDQPAEEDMARPVVLSADHCASLFPKEHCWQFTLYAQFGGSGQWTRAWEEDAEAKEAEAENGNARSIGVQIERQRWHLMTRRPGKFLLAGRARRAHVAAQKRVHLCAYWSPPAPLRRPIPPPPPPRPDLPNLYDSVPSGTAELAQIRVYCVLETAMSVESVRQQEEQQLGGVLLAEADNFRMAAKGPLCCCLEKIEFPGGEGHPSGGSQYLEIPDHAHRWCSQNGLHFQLIVPGVPTSAPSPVLPRSLSGRIVLYQKGNSADRQVLSFCACADDPATFRKIGRDDSSLSRLSAFGTELVSTRFQLTAPVRSRLASLLEEGKPDWHLLAIKLGLSRHIQLLQPESNPALCLLDLWEAIHAGSERALLDLLQTLRVLGRPDAVRLLELSLCRSALGSCDSQPPTLPQCPPAPFCSPEESRDELKRASSG